MLAVCPAAVIQYQQNAVIRLMNENMILSIKLTEAEKLQFKGGKIKIENMPFSRN